VRVAILVLSVDEAERLRTCLPAAAAQGADEIVVIDNASTDTTVEVAREFACVVELPARRSYAAAMNAGLDVVRDADAVLLLNADCVLGAGALDALRAHLEDDARCAAVAPKLVRDADPRCIDAAGMLLDRRRRNTVVGHGEPASAARRHSPHAPSGPKTSAVRA